MRAALCRFIAVPCRSPANRCRSSADPCRFTKNRAALSKNRAALSNNRAASLDFGSQFSLLYAPTARPWVRFVAKVLACPLEFVEIFTSIFDKNEIHFSPVWLWWNFFLCLPPGARVIPRFEQRKRLMKSRNRDFKFRFVPKVPVWLWRELFLCLCARKIRLLF